MSHNKSQPAYSSHRVQLSNEAKSIVFKSEKDNRPFGVLMVAGAGGGVSGPNGSYLMLGPKLATELNVPSIVVDYRIPNHMEHCMEDVHVGVKYMKDTFGLEKLIIVGWSFGGAIAITGGAAVLETVGVVTLASQTYGTDNVGELGKKGKKLLLIHGTADKCLTDNCSKSLYRSAHKDASLKELVLLEGDNHCFTKNTDGIVTRMLDFARGLFGSPNDDTKAAPQ